MRYARKFFGIAAILAVLGWTFVPLTYAQTDATTPTTTTTDFDDDGPDVGWLGLLGLVGLLGLRRRPTTTTYGENAQGRTARA